MSRAAAPRAGRKERGCTGVYVVAGTGTVVGVSVKDVVTVVFVIGTGVGFVVGTGLSGTRV